MINLGIVKRIISDNDLIISDTAKNGPCQKVELYDYKDSHARKALREYIANLTIDDIIDLCALMDYGRDRCNNPTLEKDLEEFNVIRKDYVLTMKDKTSENVVSYLLAKGEKLSEYLMRALELY